MTGPAGLPRVHGNPFTTKIGPLPVAVWAIIVVGVGGGIYYVVKRRSGTTSTNATVADNTSSGADVSGGDGTTDQTATGWSGNTPANSGASTANGTPVASTNAQWAANASNALIASGMDPTTVSNALADYLGGKALPPAEQAIINIALQRYGTPPEGVIPVVKQPTPGPPVTSHPAPPPVPKHAPPPVKKPSARTYVVQPGDNLTRIALKFYGNSNWQKIYSANRGVIGPNPNIIRPGEHLVIPS